MHRGPTTLPRSMAACYSLQANGLVLLNDLSTEDLGGKILPMQTELNPYKSRKLCASEKMFKFMKNVRKFSFKVKYTTCLYRLGADLARLLSFCEHSQSL